MSDLEGPATGLVTPPLEEGTLADASSARVCKEEGQPELHKQPLSFLTNFAIGVSKERKFFPQTQESLALMNFLFDIFLQPLVSMEQKLNELNLNYVHKSTLNHHQAGRSLCPACTKTAQEVELDLQLTIQELRMAIIHLYQNTNFHIFPQRFDEGQPHTCWHSLQGQGHLSRDCQVSPLHFTYTRIKTPFCVSQPTVPNI